MAINGKSPEYYGYRFIQALKRGHFSLPDHASSDVPTRGEFPHAMSRTDQIAAAWQMIEHILPQAGKLAEKLAIPPGLELLRQDGVEYIDGGAEHEVYKLTLPDATWALKTHYSQAYSKVTADDSIDTILHRYEYIKQWYSDVSNCIPEEYFALLPNFQFFPSLKSLHMPKKTALAIFQPFIDPPRKDVFEDFSRKGLVAILTNHPALQHDFTSFVNRTRDLYINEGTGIDIDSRGNLILWANDERLIFLEPHSAYSHEVLNKHPSRRARFERRLKYLSDVSGELHQ